MNLIEPFIINDEFYSREELLALAKNAINNEKTVSWKSEFYRFILDFFQEGTPLTQKTSGTTGDPKILVLNRESMILSAKMTIDHFNLLPGDKALLCLPVQYIAGKMMVVRALVGGLNLQTAEPSGCPLQNVRTDIRFAAMVPLQLFESLKNNDSPERFEKLLIGGGEISPKLRVEIGQLKGVEVYETFAMSETYTHFAVKRINGDSPEKAFTVLNGVNIDRDDRGCLTVDIPGLTDGRIISNDLVSIIGKNRFEWLGRIDNLINSGGIKIIPELLEERIREVIDQDLVLLGIPDERLGQRVVMVVEGEEIDSPIDPWMGKIRGIFSKHEIPREIFFIPSFPRNSAMKIERTKLKEMIWSKQ